MAQPAAKVVSIAELLAERKVEVVPRLALKVPVEAAAALGVSVDFFNAHIRPELRINRPSKSEHRDVMQLVSVDELRRWLEVTGERALDR